MHGHAARAMANPKRAGARRGRGVPTFACRRTGAQTPTAFPAFGTACETRSTPAHCAGAKDTYTGPGPAPGPAAKQSAFALPGGLPTSLREAAPHALTLQGLWAACVKPKRV